MFQVYLVEHDAHLNHLFSLYLQKEGWAITAFHNGEKAFNYIDKCPHIWVVDSGLPDIDGYQILSEVKEKYPKIPVVFISERGSSTDKVIGLELGCDDYLGKPFLPKELAIRVRKILERTYDGLVSSMRKMAYHVPPYEIDEIARLVYTEAGVVNLTSKEFDLLLLLAKNPLRTFSRDQIIKYVWNNENYGTDRAVDNLMRRLRRKMKFLRIESIYGYGYRLLHNP